MASLHEEVRTPMMEWLSLFGLILGVFVISGVGLLVVLVPFYWIFEWGDRHFGFGIGFAAGILWMIFSGAAITAAIFTIA